MKGITALAGIHCIRTDLGVRGGVENGVEPPSFTHSFVHSTIGALLVSQWTAILASHLMFLHTSNTMHVTHHSFFF